MNVLDLFSGIGGFSLGLERAGMHTVAFCEIDPYCQAVLAKHWPGVPIHGDIRTLDAAAVAAYAGSSGGRSGFGAGESRPETTYRGIDLICGGFPCQPFSVAGKRRGAEDDRHLWPEMARVIAEVRPAWVVGENVAGLVKLGLDSVLSDLEGMGYAVWPVVLPACAVDAPHRRDRLWIVAHAKELFGNVCQHHAGGNSEGWRAVPQSGNGGGGEDVADTDQPGSRGRGQLRECGDKRTAGQIGGSEHFEWLPEPDVGRVANGVPKRVDRLKALGNAVVPQVVEVIGRAIIKAEGLKL